LFTFNLDESKLQKQTNLNPRLEDINLAKQEKIEYEARDGLRIEGVLLYPLNFTEGERYPLIVYIHGDGENPGNQRRRGKRRRLWGRPNLDLRGGPDRQFALHLHGQRR